jgi:hypothetical protein
LHDQSLRGSGTQQHQVRVIIGAVAGKVMSRRDPIASVAQNDSLE